MKGLHILCLLMVLCLLPSVQAAQEIRSSAKLLVVAPEAFHPALKDFITHKRKLLHAELTSLEGILRTSNGIDDPEKLKHFLFQEWKAERLTHTLLVGDVDVLPVRYMVLDRVTPAAFDYSFYPSDLYYADLAKADGSFDDWNAQKDGFHAQYFGEVRGEKNKTDPINFDQVDYRPDIAVGRWPVSTPEEAKLVASKTIDYEERVLRNQATNLHRAAFFAVGGWVDSRRFMDRLANSLTNSWQVEKRYYSETNRPSGTPPPDHSQLRDLMNAGIGLAVHTGHGQSDSWEKCFNLKDLARITNASALPIVISAGCSTAYFAPLPPYDPYVDTAGHEHKGTYKKEVFTAPPPPPSPYQRGRYNPTGLGEQLLKQSTNGAVAYIGCNTGSQPCGLTLVEGFVAAIADSKEPRLGDLWNSAIRYYYDRQRLATLKPDKDWYPPSIFFQGMKFMMFGDPSLRLPTQKER
jgi:Peptidase family C25